MAGRLKPQSLPFHYRAGKTVLHRAPAAIKLLCVIMLSAAAFSSTYGLAAAILLILAASLAARIPPHELLKGSKPLIILSLCIVLLKTVQAGEGIATPEIVICNFYIPDIYLPNISAKGFVDGIIMFLRMALTFAAAALLFSVTTMRELRLSLAAIEISLKKLWGVSHRGARRAKKPTAYFSLSICLMLGFMPRFFDLWETANLACEARSCKRGLRRLFILIPLVTEQMMEAAADTALSLEARALGQAV